MRISAQAIIRNILSYNYISATAIFIAWVLHAWISAFEFCVALYCPVLVRFSQTADSDRMTNTV